MNTGVKQAMILFSVALNIGFISIAAYNFFHHPESREQRRWHELMVILDDMELPQSQKDQVIDRLSEFKKNFKALNSQVRQSRQAAMVFLADPAPLNSVRLDELVTDSQKLAQERQKMFQTHVIELNRLLGDKKRARFFHLILENKKAKYGKKN